MKFSNNDILELKNRYSLLDKQLERDQSDISEWKEMLGVSNDPQEYELFKTQLQNETNKNQEKYNSFSKVDSLCKEWIKRVQQGDGLLQESLNDAKIVGATCLGIAGLSSQIELNFDCVIIDEAFTFVSYSGLFSANLRAILNFCLTLPERYSSAACQPLYGSSELSGSLKITPFNPSITSSAEAGILQSSC